MHKLIVTSFYKIGLKCNNVKKISLHVSTFSIRLLNIIKIAIFTKLVYKKLLEELQEKDKLTK
ncbi:hypothetical protein C1645_842490 [Glomus cerebriforme]|uniref:Uncharacterized protein n=1 Tax=Glomus cerebriforme TaxID=658196 RepID=A0A397RYE3_9GLOM|nr:hypothetical protein C1645_842490 [Glomus cerebriforme]